jgi:hypothetical protein
VLINDGINSLETKSYRGKMVIQCNMKITIETERLILREILPLCLRDVSIGFKSNVRSYLVNNIVNSIQQSMAYIEKLRLNTLKYYGRYAVVLKETMRLLAGQV